MRTLWSTAAVFVLLAGAAEAREYGPKVGERLPEFHLQDQDGKTRSLRDLAGPKGSVVLFFRSADW